MAKRRKRTQASGTSAGRTKIRTAPLLMLIALAAAGIGGTWYGFKAVLFAGQLKFGILAVIGSGLIQGLSGAAIGAALVGLLALFCGASLGPRFSYPFALSLFAGLGYLTSVSLEYFEVATYSDSFWAIGITVLILASIIAEVLASGIPGYGKKARTPAAVWTLLILLAGTALIWSQSGEQAFSWWFVAQAISFAAYGGSLGAITAVLKSVR
jgi:hypothetical protein